MNPYTPLDPTVRARAAEAFATDNSGRHAGTFFDMLNVTGRRGQTIKNIIADNPDIATTLDENGRFDIPQLARTFAGVNDDDIAKALALKDQRLRKTSDLGVRAADAGVSYNTTTSQSKLRKDVEEAEELTRLKGVANNTPGGDLLIGKLKAAGPLTSQALLSGITGLKETNRTGDAVYQQKLKAGDQNIAASKATIASNKSTQAFQQATTKFNQEQAAKNDKNRWEDKREQRQQQALTREMNAENNMMQMQLEYSRLDRQDKRDAKSDKDKMIMLLVQGLGNLATSFTV